LRTPELLKGEGERISGRENKWENSTTSPGSFSHFEGFSRDNLWRLQMFYLAYKDHVKLAQLVPQEEG